LNPPITVFVAYGSMATDVSFCGFALNVTRVSFARME
jgi:hypothetical protein